MSMYPFHILDIRVCLYSVVARRITNFTNFTKMSLQYFEAVYLFLRMEYHNAGTNAMSAMQRGDHGRCFGLFWPYSFDSFLCHNFSVMASDYCNYVLFQFNVSITFAINPPSQPLCNRYFTPSTFVSPHLSWPSSPVLPGTYVSYGNWTCFVQIQQWFLYRHIHNP